MVLLEIAKEHIKCVRQITKLAKSDIIRTYRGAALGWMWAIIKPAISIFVYWFVFAIGLRGGKPIGGYPFFLWLIAGIVPWFYMSDMLTSGMKCIGRYSYLVTKMKFPISIIPTFISLSKIMVNMALLIFVIIIYIGMGYPPDIYILQLPIYIFLMFVFFTVLTLFTSLLAVISKDFSNLLKSLVKAIFWLSGVMWNIDTLNIDWLKKALMFNPVTFLSNGVRNCFINKVWIWEQPKRLLYFGIVFIITLLLSLWAYKKLEKEIPDVL